MLLCRDTHSDKKTGDRKCYANKINSDVNKTD